MEGECAGDVACLCRDEAFVVGSTECIATSCEGDDLENANRVARESCASVVSKFPRTISISSNEFLFV